MTAENLIRIMCPNLSCQRILAVPTSARGKVVRCRVCGMNVRIPLNKPPVDKPAKPAEPAAQDAEAEAPELAQPFEMSLPAISKHIKVLEQTGLIARSKVGRTHWCHLNPEPLRGAIDLLAHYDFFWKRALDSLDNYAQGDQR